MVEREFPIVCLLIFVSVPRIVIVQNFTFMALIDSKILFWNNQERQEVIFFFFKYSNSQSDFSLYIIYRKITKTQGNQSDIVRLKLLI